jgi:hypothetical protein
MSGDQLNGTRRKSHDLWPADMERDSAHQDALRFMQDFEAKDGVDYEWVSDYANGLWDHRVKIYSTLDDKADAIIRYLGGGTGLFALGVLAKVEPANAYLVYWSMPAVLSALVSLFFAARVKIPSFAPSAPTVKQAIVEFADADATPKKAKAEFLGHLHLACEDMKLVCNRKAAWLEWATRLYIAALFLLAMPLAVAAYCPPTPLK